MDEILRQIAATLFDQSQSMSMIAQVRRLGELSITDRDEIMVVLQEYRRLLKADPTENSP